MTKIGLTPTPYLQTLVENRRVFNLHNCELSIYESYAAASHIPLAFNDVVITSMIRGKKIMHVFDDPSFEYNPGETLIFPANETMVIDFPEAAPETPTQCIALTVDSDYINNTIQYLNNYYNAEDEKHHWKLEFNQYHFLNDKEVANLIDKIIRVCTSPDRAKDIFVDLSLKELLIRLVQTQRLFLTANQSQAQENHSRLHFILNYIRQNLAEKIAVDDLCRKAYLSRNGFFKWFREQCGVSPLEYINAERVKMAKQLLADPRHDIRAVSDRCGFTDVNYFTRVFRKIEGITPGGYQGCLKNNNGKYQ
ncbi:MAG: AraC family transcriptional regulator [Candidatus Pseudobacter hemicellulosilyticus]|uniref:AraC family transcriptional regulator n=1 Tax=Candidatus Pseudobacter hemicellulosilyticus TaxID=3121375 RepID=A0AAJ6BHL3_9BACT|nr:MAG: AraC family transcriptional regulator [Pseudobacter sp.]